MKKLPYYIPIQNCHKVQALVIFKVIQREVMFQVLFIIFTNYLTQRKELFEYEIRKKLYFIRVLALKSKRKIATLMKCSKTTFHIVIIKKKSKRKIKRSWWKKKLTGRNNRQVFRLSTKEGLTTHEISTCLSKTTSHVTVWKSFQSNSNTNFKKIKKKQSFGNIIERKDWNGLKTSRHETISGNKLFFWWK